MDDFSEEDMEAYSQFSELAAALEDIKCVTAHQFILSPNSFLQKFDSLSNDDCQTISISTNANETIDSGIDSHDFTTNDDSGSNTTATLLSDSLSLPSFLGNNPNDTIDSGIDSYDFTADESEPSMSIDFIKTENYRKQKVESPTNSPKEKADPITSARFPPLSSLNGTELQPLRRNLSFLSLDSDDDDNEPSVSTSYPFRTNYFRRRRYGLSKTGLSPAHIESAGTCIDIGSTAASTSSPNLLRRKLIYSYFKVEKKCKRLKKKNKLLKNVVTGRSKMMEKPYDKIGSSEINFSITNPNVSEPLTDRQRMGRKETCDCLCFCPEINNEIDGPTPISQLHSSMKCLQPEKLSELQAL